MIIKQICNNLDEYHWFNEPDFISIKINKEFRNHIFEIALDRAKTMTNLSKLTKLSKQTLFNQMYGKGMNVKGLKKLLEFINIDFMEVYGNINKMGWNNFKLPLRLNSKDSAVVFAAILGDGSNTTKVMYKNKDQALLDKVERNTKRWLGKAVIDHRISSIGIPYITFPEITGRVLSFVGIPSGKKTISNPGIPEVIKKSKKSIKKAFIQQFFDDEGWPEPDQMKVATSQCIDCTSKLTKEFIASIKDKKVVYLKDIPLTIKNKIKAPNILIDIKKLLSDDFGINSNIRFKRLFVYIEKITAGFELEIYRKEDVKKFFKEINFYSPSKREKLEFMINRNRCFPQNIMLLIINEAIQLSKSKGYFLTHEVAKNLGFPQPPIRKRLITLVKRGIFDKKKEKFFVNILI